MFTVAASQLQVLDFTSFINEHNCGLSFRNMIEFLAFHKIKTTHFQIQIANFFSSFPKSDLLKSNKLLIGLDGKTVFEPSQFIQAIQRLYDKEHSKSTCLIISFSESDKAHDWLALLSKALWLSSFDVLGICSHSTLQACSWIFNWTMLFHIFLNSSLLQPHYLASISHRLLWLSRSSSFGAHLHFHRSSSLNFTGYLFNNSIKTLKIGFSLLNNSRLQLPNTIHPLSTHPFHLLLSIYLDSNYII